INKYAEDYSWIGPPNGSFVPVPHTGHNDSAGRMRQFENENVSVWVDQCVGKVAHSVQGAIDTRYYALGSAAISDFGYPVSDELETPTNDGRVSYFQGGGIYCKKPQEGCVTLGSIRGWNWDQYVNLNFGYTTGNGLGYPTSDEKDFNSN